MRRVNLEFRNVKFIGGLSSIALVLLTGCSAPVKTGVTVFEGARLIVGDGSRPIDNAAFVIQNGQFTAVGPNGQVTVPAGAERVDLTGKTVMPAIVDAHKHLAVTRDALVDQLEHLAYYGVGVAMSMGQDTGDVAFQVRAETIPNAARSRTAGRGLTGPEPGRTEAPYWVKTEAEVRKEHASIAGSGAFGVPTLVVDDAAPLFGPVIDAVPTGEAAGELWDHVTWLLRQPNFLELKRVRP